MINYQLFRPVFFKNQTCDEFDEMLRSAISDPEGYDYIKLIDILQKKVYDKVFDSIKEDISDIALELNLSIDEINSTFSEIIKSFEKYSDKKTLLHELKKKLIVSFSCYNSENVKLIIEIVENKLVSIDKESYLEILFNKIKDQFSIEISEKIILLIEKIISNDNHYKTLSNSLRYIYNDDILLPNSRIYSKLLLILVESEEEYF
jgi:hypothetical protein